MIFLENSLIDGDLRRDALALQKSGDWDDAGPKAAEAIGAFSGGTALKPDTITSQDDEYRWAGVEDPKVMITTSRDPSARLKKFAKVRMELCFPKYLARFRYDNSLYPVVTTYLSCRSFA